MRLEGGEFGRIASSSEFVGPPYRRQPLLADSTTSAELMAATDASKQNVWLRRMFADLGFPQKAPTTIFEDNESCKKLSRNYCAHDRVKHLDVREMLVREHHNTTNEN